MFDRTDYCAGLWVPPVTVLFGIVTAIVYGFYLPTVVRWCRKIGLPGFSLIEPGTFAMRVAQVACFIAGGFVFVGVAIALSGAC
jgi:hypothetical protein